MERALIVTRGPSILPEHLPVQFLGTSTIPTVSTPNVDSGLGLGLGATSALPDFDLSIEAAERDQIRKALEAAGGKRMEAARLLGLSRRTLYRKLDKYGIT
jgi:DNA-binding NtrC family response regulator